MCDLGIFGLFVAFLVFMALKVKLKTLAEFSKPFDYIMAKKYIKNLFFCYLVFEVAFKNFFWPFSFFLRYFMSKSSLGCSSPISKFNIIPKGKWFKFPISNHSDCHFSIIDVHFTVHVF